MAKRRSDNAIGLGRTDYRRVIDAIQYVEQLPRSDPYQATRWPKEQPIRGSRFGIVFDVLPACSRVPVMAREYRLCESFFGGPQCQNAAGQALQFEPVVDNNLQQIEFKVIEPHGETVPYGLMASFIHAAGDIWVPISVHCGLNAYTDCTNGTSLG